MIRFLFLLLVLAFPAFAQPTSWTTDRRPNPVDGLTGFNTTMGYQEAYSSALAKWYPVNGPVAWNAIPQVFAASNLSGTPTIVSGGTGYAANDTFTINAGCTVNPAGSVVAVSGGVVTQYAISTPGQCSGSFTTSAITTTKVSGSGTGLVVTPSFLPIAANVAFLPWTGNANGPMVLGAGAGVGMAYGNLGNSGYGIYTMGGGGWTGDGMGGGTGMTGAENSGFGWQTLTQVTTGFWLNAFGTSALSHETDGTYCGAFGGDAAKYVLHCNRSYFIGTNAGKFVLSPGYTTIVGDNSMPGGQFIASVSGAVNNGGGLCRLTVSTTGMLTGDTAVVTGILGAPACNGLFTNVTVVDGTHLDLTGSTFAGTYTSGGTVTDYADVAGASQITIVGANSLTNTAWRPANNHGRISWVGSGSLNVATDIYDFVGMGQGSATAVTTAIQTVIIGTSAGNTLTNQGGVVVIGYNADVASNTTYEAVAIGASFAGGGQGAIAGLQGITIGGAQAGNHNLGSNTIIISPGGGHTTCNGGNHVLILNTGSRDCDGGSETGTGHIGNNGTDVIGWTGGKNAAALISALGPTVVKGTKFTISGCSAGTTIGGAASGTFASGTTGTCTVVITMAGATGLTAPNGWRCTADDLTTPANSIHQSASSTTTCTVTGTTTSGDVISFSAFPF